MGAKVRWIDVCTHNDKSDLRFKPLKDWNKATMLRHLWSMKVDSLWIKWVHMYIIKYYNLWHMETSGDASWIIKKLFKL